MARFRPVSYTHLDVYKRQIIHYPRIKRLQTSPLSYPVDIENQMKAALCMSSPQKLREAFRDFQSYFRKGLLYDPKDVYKRQSGACGL